MRPANILIFDSGLGGLTVHAAVRDIRPDVRMSYVADDAAFPYGSLAESVVVDRVQQVIAAQLAAAPADIVVIACNTASTLVLPHLRTRWPELPFVGTVPAVKPAAEQSRTRQISVLATPATVARDYTRDLIRTYAGHCDVTLVGSEILARLAEAGMHGETADDTVIAREIMPAFVDNGGRRTDHIVLACTHYPLLLNSFRKLAPWPVDWVDPAPAIARRIDHVLHELRLPPAAGAAQATVGQITFTSGFVPRGPLAEALHARCLEPAASLTPAFAS